MRPRTLAETAERYPGTARNPINHPKLLIKTNQLTGLLEKILVAERSFTKICFRNLSGKSVHVESFY